MHRRGIVNGSIMHYTAHMRLLSELGKGVADLRRGQGLSRAKLAERSGLSQRFLADVESGQGNISLVKLAKICEALQVTLAGLINALPSSHRQNGHNPYASILSLLPELPL